MMATPSHSGERPVEVRVYRGADLAHCLHRLEQYALRSPRVSLSRHPGWLAVFEQGLQHTAYALEAVADEETRGFLALCYVRSVLFGRYLVGLPYLNTGGALADDEATQHLLLNRALELADELKVRHLELRHEQPVRFPALNGSYVGKVHMRLALPSFPGPLWEGLSGKVRNQVRKGEKNGLKVAWGSEELLPEFYAVFSQNMRDLGTPVYSQALFQNILRQFPGDAELCVVRAGYYPLAGALLLHGRGISEVASASALRAYNHICANMLLYWNLLDRAIQRGQDVFDFGRCTVNGSLYRFKKQWGARPEPDTWQYYLRKGRPDELRKENPGYQRLIRIWQRLPVGITRLIGPAIVRGIP